VGVVVNDFGAINVDAALVAGQVDEAESIAGGCVCCLDDAGGLDDALARLTHPRLRLDAVIVEASGMADPLTLARLIRFSGAEHARPGGVVEVVDAVRYDRTVDTAPTPPARYAAATLVVVNKVDQLPAAERDGVVAAITARVRECNPLVPVLATSHGRIDPALVYDTAADEDPPDQLPLAALAREDRAVHADGHLHAAAVTVRVAGPVDAGAVVDVLEDPPAGVYRIKGCVPVHTGRGQRRYVVELVGRSVHVRTAPPRQAAHGDGLVAIGPDLDEDAVRARLEQALRPVTHPTAAGLRRLQRHRRLSR
jgi:G3E family GTPase